MYSKTLKSKIEVMFSEMGDKVSDIITNAPSFRMASDNIATLVASETATRSKTMLSDLYSEMSKQVLDSLHDISKQNRFYEVNLRQEIFDKYNFEVPSNGINFKEANRVYCSIAAGVGTMAVGSVFVFALSSTGPAIPIALVVAASIAAFCASYFKAMPSTNKSNFNTAVNKYLLEVKLEYIAWFDEVERYFNTRAEVIKLSI